MPGTEKKEIEGAIGVQKREINIRPIRRTGKYIRIRERQSPEMQFPDKEHFGWNIDEEIIAAIPDLTPEYLPPKRSARIG